MTTLDFASIPEAPVCIAGADGCRGGWIVVSQPVGGKPKTRVFPAFRAVIDGLPEDTIIAVDMPIGLPEVTGHGGRGPESLVRRHLGERQSSVFSIPSRHAVYAETEPCTSVDEWYAAHRRASAVARKTSDPPRGISIQAFALFPKMREIDRLLTESPALRRRVIESHPEVAFWRLNGESPMRKPKKVKGRLNPEGMAERRCLLERCGYERAFLESAPPTGADTDDFLDAAAIMLVAARYARGEAIPFPDPPMTDGHGIPIAIWA